MTITEMISELSCLSEINCNCLQSRDFVTQVATLSKMQEIADNMAEQANELRDGIHRNLASAQICLAHVRKMEQSQDLLRK